MSLELPRTIESYFAADAGNSEAVAQCFTENATVIDEGQTYQGLAAIKTWKTESTKKYIYTSVPHSVEDRDGKTIVTSHVSGNFPGSPIDLRYFFGLEGDKIASLEITL